MGYRNWGIWLCQGSWAPSGGLGRQVGTMQATGWGGGQPYKRSEESPLVMEGMWDEGLRPVWLSLDTRITPRGGSPALWADLSPKPPTTARAWCQVPRLPLLGLALGGVLARLLEEEHAASSAPVQRCSYFAKWSFSPNSS